MSLPKIIIIGRVNVGKSSLFNKLTKSNRAVVDATPGVTRDRIEKIINWNRKNFLLVDSGGFVGEIENKNNLEAKVQQQIVKGIAESYLVLFLVDAKLGLHPSDMEIANLVRKFQKKILLVANKVDNEKNKNNLSEFAKLGLNEPFWVSAKLGKNCGDLLDEITKDISIQNSEIQTIPIALVGRPNVGKSSLINAIVNEERVIVWEKPGTTRDAVDVYFNFGDKDFVFIDTAGQRKKSKVKEDIEFYSNRRSIYSLERSEIVICVLESKMLATFQEKKILDLALQKGKSIIIVVNKWDFSLSRSQVRENQLKKEFINYLYSHLTFLPNPTPIIFTVATEKTGVQNLLQTINNVLEQRNYKLKTPDLNTVLQWVQKIKQPPEGMKILYGTQIQTAPPKFLLFVKGSNFLHSSYLRFLEKYLRGKFNFLGTPIFWDFKRKENR